MTEPFLAVFDVDGTLVDSQGVIHDTMAAAFAAQGLPAPERRSVLALVGLSLPRMVEALLPGAPVETLDAVTAEYRLRYVAALEGGATPPLYDGAAAALDALEAAGATLGLATGKSLRGVRRFLAEQGWEGRFATVQCADHHPSKPNPSMLRTALRELDLAPGRAAMVGDTTFDMEMARGAGVAALGVDWGYHAADIMTAAGAEVVHGDWDAVVADILARAAAE